MSAALGGSWKIGELAGIRVQVHWTFLLLPALIAWSTLSTAGLAAALEAVVFVLLVFGCVVLHELGHALAARAYGIGTRDITLLPIGGVARLERLPRQPRQELAIALAGPVVNVVIAAAIFAGLWLGGGVLHPLAPTSSLVESFLVRLMWTNVALVIFNLLPAFPMDGGRVLRAALASRLPYAQATRAAARIGRVVAALLGIVGLFGNWTLLLIAMFIYFAGRGEEQMASQPVAPPPVTGYDPQIQIIRVNGIPVIIEPISVQDPRFNGRMG
jgi:Zn-dependent protease